MKPMTLKDYQTKCLRTFNKKDLLTDMLHMSLGMVTEASEIADVMKKHIAYGREIDIVNIKEELGDLLWFIMGMCETINLDVEDVMQTNINKLAVRYPEKYTDELALNRDLVAERSVLEQ